MHTLPPNPRPRARRPAAPRGSSRPGPWLTTSQPPSMRIALATQPFTNRTSALRRTVRSTPSWSAARRRLVGPAESAHLASSPSRAIKRNPAIAASRRPRGRGAVGWWRWPQRRPKSAAPNDACAPVVLWQTRRPPLSPVTTASSRSPGSKARAPSPGRGRPPPAPSRLEPESPRGRMKSSGRKHGGGVLRPLRAGRRRGGDAALRRLRPGRRTLLGLESEPIGARSAEP